MRSGAHKDKFLNRRQIPNQQEIRRNVTFPVAQVSATQFVHVIARFKCLPGNEPFDGLIESFHIPSSLSRALSILFELPGEGSTEHVLVVTVERREQLGRVPRVGETTTCFSVLHGGPCHFRWQRDVKRNSMTADDLLVIHRDRSGRIKAEFTKYFFGLFFEGRLEARANRGGFGHLITLSK